MKEAARLILRSIIRRCMYKTKLYRIACTNRKGYLVLMYHSITPKGEKSDYRYSVDEENFEAQLSYLRSNFEVIDLLSLVKYLEEKQSNSRTKIAITFDDGFKNNYAVAYPLLEKYGIPATIFLATEFVKRDYESFLSWNEVLKMNGTGLISFGSHSNLHINLSSIEYCDILKELKMSKEVIEERLQKNIEWFSYPVGVFNQIVKNAVKQCGYRAAFTDRQKGGHGDQDLYELPRISIDKRNQSISDFKRTILVGS